MSNPRGFLDIERRNPGYRERDERLKDFEPVEQKLSSAEVMEQATRCMDCGIPFCHGTGCPLSNVIPEWNELIASGYWEEALDMLLYTNNFPEFTGNICPAPCETACTVGIYGDEPVAIRQVERSLIEYGFESGYIKPRIPATRTGKRVAVVGSGPSGLAVADQLNQLGHLVSIYEKDPAIGGLLRFGIPDFKLGKDIVQRRVDLMSKEGVKFHTDVTIGEDITSSYLLKRFDKIVLACGAGQPRDLPVKGREAKNIHFAMDFLSQQNRRVSGFSINCEEITVKDKKVVVIGGGDTGSDCVGTSNRQGATSVTQLEIMPKPPKTRDESTPWPDWPYMLRTSSSHLEGCERIWSVMTKEFISDDSGKLKEIKIIDVEWVVEDGRRFPKEIVGSERIIEADYVFLAMGFTGPEHSQILQQFHLDYDQRTNIKVDSDYQTSVYGVFAAGDAVSGASLVVRAISEGRKCAEEVHTSLIVNR